MPSDNREKTTKTSKRNKTILTVAAVLLLFALGTFTYRQRVAVLPCTEDRGGLLTRSSQLFDPEGRGAVGFEKYAELSDVAQEIEQQRNHGRDINCLYVTANYYMYGDIDRAEANLEAIKSLREEGQEISAAFAGAGVDRLEYNILVQKTSAEETVQNTFHIKIDGEDQE